MFALGVLSSRGLLPLLAALDPAHLLQIQRAAALAATSAMLVTAAIAGTFVLVERFRASRRSAAARRKLFER